MSRIPPNIINMLFRFLMHTLGLVGMEETLIQLTKAKTLNYWLIDSYNRNLCIGDSEPKKITLSNEQITQAVNDADFSFQNDNQVYHVKEFKTTGYLCVKALSPGTNLFFSLSAFTNIGHRQADDLRFILFDSGYWRFEDPGKYTYQRDKRKYIDRTYQHNSLVVDDQSYSVRSEGQYLHVARLQGICPNMAYFIHQ